VRLLFMPFNFYQCPVAFESIAENLERKKFLNYILGSQVIND